MRVGAARRLQCRLLTLLLLGLQGPQGHAQAHGLVGRVVPLLRECRHLGLGVLVAPLPLLGMTLQPELPVRE